MEKVSIIGGSGFIGTALINSIKDGWSVTNIDKRQSLKYPEITRLADVRDVNALKANIKPSECVILLAAEHTDNVSPVSLYYEVNVQGAKNVCRACDDLKIKKIIFTSSVAVYGINKKNPTESTPPDPNNHYGKSKLEAEKVLIDWYEADKENKTLIIIRPTVVFGPTNRGNVYNLLALIASGKFIMVGDGKNIKSMAYVDNVVAFLKYCLANNASGFQLYNYVDKPDLNTHQLVEISEKALGIRIKPFKVPYFIGYGGAALVDLIANITRKKFEISRVRIEKFCATTKFSSETIKQTTFNPPYSLREGLKRTLNSIIQHRNSSPLKK